jgi:hypothetical protein
MQMRLGAPFPTRAGSGSSARPGPPVRSTCSLDSARVEVAGLAEVPIPGVALAAVHGLGARPFGDEIVAAGCLRDRLWSLVRLRGDDHKGRQFEINTAWMARDHRNWDMAAKYGRYVPASPILDRMCGSRGWKRDHSQSVGTRQERSRRERACLQAGDGRPSNHAISVLIPSRPRPHVGGPRERDRHTRTPGLRPTRFGPSRVRRANETSSARPAFRGTRRGRFCERPEVIHTLEIGVTAVRARSNNNPVDLGCVDR